MAKVRYVLVEDGNKDVYFIIQKKILFFWITQKDITNKTPLKFMSETSANAAAEIILKKYRSRQRKILNIKELT